MISTLILQVFSEEWLQSSLNLRIRFVFSIEILKVNPNNWRKGLSSFLFMEVKQLFVWDSLLVRVPLEMITAAANFWREHLYRYLIQVSAEYVIFLHCIVLDTNEIWRHSHMWNLGGVVCTGTIYKCKAISWTCKGNTSKLVYLKVLIRKSHLWVEIFQLPAD